MKAGAKTLVTVLIAVIAVAASGCSSPPENAVVELASKDRGRFVLPVDAFADREWSNTSYAELIFVSECFAHAGMHYPVAPQRIKEDGNASWNAVGRWIFDTHTAPRFGYHQQVGEGGMTDDEIVRDAKGPSLDEVGQEKFTECLGSARKKLGTENQIEQYATELAVDAYNETLEAPAVTEATARWRECMKPLGIADLKSSPSGPPADSLSIEFGLREDKPPTENVSAKELRIATFDAQCQESSGYAEAMYETEWRLQAALVKEHADKLLRVKAQIDAKNKRVHAYLAEHAPAQ